MGARTVDHNGWLTVDGAREFLADLSHEIRTPLNGVLGMIRLALKSESMEERHEYLGIAERSGECLLALLNGILDYSKMEAGRMELHPVTFNLREALAQALEAAMAGAAEKGLRLSADADEGIPEWVQGDVLRLRQVLVNLLHNAVKFTDRGEVTVSVALERGRRLLFCVSDTGAGIAADKRKLIFEPFRQAEGAGARTNGGWGLGLAICTRLVKLMGGEIRVESELGRGSRFWFTTAFEPAAAPPVAGTERRAGQAAPGALRILLAEDNEINRRVAQRLLETRGHAVTAVTNGADALEAALAGEFDVVLMDVQMPGMDGLEATRAIRARAADLPGDYLPIIAMTAHAMKGDRERCLAAGMDAYLSKPVRPEALLEAIDAAASAYK